MRNNNLEEFGDKFQVAQNAGISVFGNSIQKVLRYFSALLLTHILGAGTYGIYILALSIVEIGKIFSVLGLNYSMIRYISIFAAEKDNEKIKGLIRFVLKSTFYLSILFTFLLFISAEYISVEILSKPELLVPLRILTISLPIIGLTFVIVGSFRGFKKLKYQVYVEGLFIPILRVIFIAICFILGYKLYGILAAVIAAGIFGLVLSVYYLIKLFPMIGSKRWQGKVNMKSVIGYSFPLFLTVFLNIFINRTDIMMLGYFVDSKDVGVYSIAYRISQLVFFISVSFVGIFAPMVSELHSRNEIERLRSLLKTVARWVLTLSLPIFIILVIYPAKILSLFGEEFVEGTNVLYILSISTLFSSVIGLSGHLITMSGRAKLTLVNSLSAAFLNVVLNLWLIPKYGMMGAAIGTAISISVVNLARFVEVLFLEKMQLLNTGMLKPIFIGALSTSITLWLNGFIEIESDFISIIVMAAILFTNYVGLFFLFKFHEDDKKIIAELRKRILGSPSKLNYRGR